MSCRAGWCTDIAKTTKLRLILNCRLEDKPSDAIPVQSFSRFCIVSSCRRSCRIQANLTLKYSFPTAPSLAYSDELLAKFPKTHSKAAPGGEMEIHPPVVGTAHKSYRLTPAAFTSFYNPLRWLDTCAREESL